MTRHRGHAVVVGGSIAGMIAARVLSEFFERVTVLERDAEPRAASHRPGVPHSPHVHILLRAGQNAFEALFPGFESDLVAAGSISVRARYDAINIIGQDVWPRRDLGIVNRAQSRELLESVVRQHLRAVANVEHRWTCRAEGVPVIIRRPISPASARSRRASLRPCCTTPSPTSSRSNRLRATAIAET